MKSSYGCDISDLKPVGEIPEIKGNEGLPKMGIELELWKNIVVPVIKEKFNNECCICNSDKNLQIHHKSYEEQNINTLFLVCKSCHTDIHKSELDNNDFIKLYEQGLNDKEISEKLKVNISSVLRRRHKLLGRKK